MKFAKNKTLQGVRGGCKVCFVQMQTKHFDGEKNNFALGEKHNCARGLGEHFLR